MTFNVLSVTWATLVANVFTLTCARVAPPRRLLRLLQTLTCTSATREDRRVRQTPTDSPSKESLGTKAPDNEGENVWQEFDEKRNVENWKVFVRCLDKVFFVFSSVFLGVSASYVVFHM